MFNGSLTTRLKQACPIIPVWLVSVCLVGCGGDGTNRISGKVVFKGQPVPAGKIYFTPDGSKGNSGPAGYANIKDGVYDTAAAGGMGSVAGPVIVTIEGIDPGSPGNQLDEDDESSDEITAKTLFTNYETTIEVSGSMTQDFDVPASATRIAVNGEKEFIQP